MTTASAAITSNPAIFEQAIAGSREYADLIGDLHARRLDALSIYETLAIRDIRQAADLLRPHLRFIEVPRWVCQLRGISVIGA
jgi:transaldolase